MNLEDCIPSALEANTPALKRFELLDQEDLQLTMAERARKCFLAEGHRNNFRTSGFFRGHINPDEAMQYMSELNNSYRLGLTIDFVHKHVYFAHKAVGVYEPDVAMFMMPYTIGEEVDTRRYTRRLPVSTRYHILECIYCGLTRGYLIREIT